jgi:hypothetical protein
VTGELFLDLDIGLPVQLLRRLLRVILKTQAPAEPVGWRRWTGMAAGST